MQNFLVIGASSGIGKALAAQLAKAGHHVIGTYYKNEPSAIQAGLSMHPLNMLDKTLVFDFLPDTLNGIVYCPGSIHLRPFERIKPRILEADYQLQVMGAIKVLQACLPKLKKSPNASILLFSTVCRANGYALSFIGVHFKRRY
jgi:NAD(P)-dependent dehydrogenase (short-subunit alcohol dehydrogenase family)